MRNFLVEEALITNKMARVNTKVMSMKKEVAHNFSNVAHWALYGWNSPFKWKDVTQLLVH